jgi:secondary thiamine-phosphate synthase enzyme
MVIKKLNVSTGKSQELLDITSMIRQIVKESGVSSGICVIYVPHTTAGITINENADPDVRKDIIDTLEEKIPSVGTYHHAEGNAHAHIKASMMGASISVLIESGRVVLGTWQGIFLCEFDGPRARTILVKVMASQTR